MQILNYIVITHSNYTLIVWFSAPHMSNAINRPHGIQGNHVSYEYLRYNSSVPCLIP